jgi:glyoxylase-like metal-dependent hydrolase (beta-lactamase superfamily II)
VSVPLWIAALLLGLLAALFAVVALLWWKLAGISADMRLHRLAPDVYVYRGFFSNSAVLVLPRSVVVIDTQTSPQVAMRLRRQIAAITDKPVTHVINTHYHGDHVGGNAAFPEAEVIAPAETARYVVERDTERVEYCRTFGLHLQEVPPVRPPDRTFEGRLSLVVDGEPLEIAQIGRCETPDACVVWWPARRVLVAGDGVATDQYPWLGVPFLDEGLQDDGQWLGYLRAITAYGPAVLIPGHGAPLVGVEVVRARLALLEELLTALLESVRAEIAAGTPFPTLVDRVDAKLARFRQRPDLAERVVSQRFAIYRAYNSVHPDRRGKGWWHELRPKVLRDVPADTVAAALAGRPRPGADPAAAVRREATRLARADRPLAIAVLAAWLVTHPDDAETWAFRSEIEVGGAVRTRPIVDATEYVNAAGASSRRALAVDPEHVLAALNLGIVEVWSALVTGQAMAAAVARLEAALARPGLSLPQRLRGRFFLAKAHQSEGRDAEADVAFRSLLPGPLCWFAPVLVPRLRTFP